MAKVRMEPTTTIRSDATSAGSTCPSPEHFIRGRVINESLRHNCSLLYFIHHQLIDLDTAMALHCYALKSADYKMIAGN